MDIKTIPLTKGKVAIVDAEDYNYLLDINWHCSNKGYAETTVTYNHKRKRFAMHRMIMRADKNQIVDHINGNRLDNRKANLRFVSHSQNMQNRKSASNTGYLGVSYNTTDKVYKATIKADNQVHYLGSFKNVFDAALAYNIAALTYRRGYVKLNKLQTSSV